MCVKAIRLDKTDELHLKILSSMFGEDRGGARVKFADLSKEFEESEETIRYNVKKLKRLGYIREKDDKYEPTEKVLFLKVKNG